MSHSSNRVTCDVYAHILRIVDDAPRTEIVRLFLESIARETEAAKLSHPCLPTLARVSRREGDRESSTHLCLPVAKPLAAELAYVIAIAASLLNLARKLPRQWNRE